MDMSVSEIAELVGGTVAGDGRVRVTGVNGIEEASHGDLTFLGDPRFASHLATTGASAILVAPGCNHTDRVLIHVPNPHLAFAQVLKRYEAESLVHPSGVHPTAVVGDGVVLGSNVALDAHVRLADGCRIGDNTVLYAGVYVGRGSSIGPYSVVFSNVSIREGVTIGARCILHNNVSIGADGFGYEALNGVQTKIPQVGTVAIGDDVEIGANSAVDRATCGKTTIGDGTKIDNLVQIGHNVSIGRNCIISGSTGIAGSARIGNYVTVGGYVGIGGHLEIGDHARVGARSGVTKSVAPHAVVSGYPAQDHETSKRIIVSQRRLPEIFKRVGDLENRIQELEERLNG